MKYKENDIVKCIDFSNSRTSSYIGHSYVVKDQILDKIFIKNRLNSNKNDFPVYFYSFEIEKISLDDNIICRKRVK